MIQGAPFGKQIAPIQECCLAETPVSLLLSHTLLMPPLGGGKKSGAPKNSPGVFTYS